MTPARRRRRNPYRQAALLLCIAFGTLFVVGWAATLFYPPPGDERHCLNKAANEFYRCVWEMKYGKRGGQ